MDDKMQAALMDMMNKMGGIENFQANPMAFIGEVFKHPEILSQLDALVKTPEMQQEIAASMNNPMFKQILANNPILSGLANQYSKGAPTAQYGASNDENDDIDAEILPEQEQIDPKSFKPEGWTPIDWLNPPSGMPFFFSDDPDKNVRFSDMLDELPEECRDRVTEIANARLALHLDDAHRDRLQTMASDHGLTPLDLVATQGFMGEVAYVSSLIMPEDDLCDLAKFSLRALRTRSAYPVASYLLQVMIYIDDFDDFDDDDWNNFIWALSSNPIPGRDGNFFASDDDLQTMLEIACQKFDDNPDLAFAVILALFNWNVVRPHLSQSPFSDLLENNDIDAKLKQKIAEALEGKKFYGVSLLSLPEFAVEDAKSLQNS